MHNNAAGLIIRELVRAPLGLSEGLVEGDVADAEPVDEPTWDDDCLLLKEGMSDMG
jgi:hypothetical protein